MRALDAVAGFFFVLAAAFLVTFLAGAFFFEAEGFDLGLALTLFFFKGVLFFRAAEDELGFFFFFAGVPREACLFGGGFVAFVADFFLAGVRFALFFFVALAMVFSRSLYENWVSLTSCPPYAEVFERSLNLVPGYPNFPGIHR